MSIIVNQENFKDITVDLRVLLENVKSTLDSDMGEFITHIIIVHNPDDHFPMVYFKKNIDGNILVNLGVHNRDWCRYTYQFAHEYCHIRTNYRRGGKKYSWFEESICEVASHYALRKMSKSWENKPPYPNWKDFRKNLLDYSNKNFEEKPLSKENFIKFMNEKISELELADTDNHRNYYKIIARQLIPFFEESPELWRAMTYWNKWEINSNDDYKEVFKNWLNILPIDLKDIATKLIEQFSK